MPNIHNNVNTLRKLDGTFQRTPSKITIVGDGRALIELHGKYANGRHAIIDEADVPLVQGRGLAAHIGKRSMLTPVAHTTAWRD